MGLAPGFVAAHLRVDANCPFGEEIDSFAEAIDCVCRALNTAVLLVPMALHGANDDRPVLRKVAESLECRSEILTREDSAVVKACLAHASVALGVAKHFVVFAASVGVPTVGCYRTEYMRQKLAGAARVFPHTRAEGVDRFSPESLAELACHMARDLAECESPRALIPTLPPAYWGWLDLLAEQGIAADCSTLAPTPIADEFVE